MEWNHLIYFALPAVFCWGMGAMAAYRPGKSLQVVLWTVAGLAIFMAFIVGMWVSLERPPLRTMGETRLWYSFFLPVAGIITYIRWRYKWILSFSTVMSLVFICINLFKPEIHNKTLMPALQSPWFAPHVIVYMFAYAMLGAGAVVAVYLLVRSRKRAIEPGVMNLCDNLVYVGTAFLTIGMLFGALWAKEAWGHYWSDLAGQSAVYTLPVSEEQTVQVSPWNTGVRFYLAASLLVRRELSAFGTRQQRTRLQYGITNKKKYQLKT